MKDAMEITVACKDEATKANYEKLTEKMMADETFKADLKQCKSAEEAYDVYKKHGYTDLEFDSFCVQFHKTLEIIVKSQEGNYELTDEELENVVGGLSAFRYLLAAISALPVTGPFLAGALKGIQNTFNSGAFSGIMVNISLGASGRLHDSVIKITSAKPSDASL